MGKYSWKFKSLLPIIFAEQSECIICGSKENLNVHHVNHASSDDEEYARKSNVVVLCRSCHEKYHNTYPNSTPLTLLKFTKEECKECKRDYELRIAMLQRELSQYKDLVNYLLQMQ